MKPLKITFIGAGSTVFAKRLMCDVFISDAISHADVYLYDIDQTRLKTSEIVGKRIVEQLGVRGSVTATTDRHEALRHANYVVTMFQVGGFRPGTVTDFEVPKEFGLRQTIADTLGIGGIMRGLRTVPVLLDYAREMEDLCPDALLLQYANPMCMAMWALESASTIKSVGLCHSVQRTAKELATDLGLDVAQVNYLVAGINHMAFFLRFEQDGRDLYPDLHRVIAEDRVPKTNRVRYEMLSRLGFFVTESSEHFCEYVPWFIKHGRDDLLGRYNIPLDEYIKRSEKQIARWDGLKRKLEDRTTPLKLQRSDEFGTSIIEAMETGSPAVIYGNVRNRGLIDNLPGDCIVEVPCLVDANGIQPVRIGALPQHLAALMQSNINVQSLTVEALLTGRRDHIYHAAMLDPHTAAELDLDQIWSLVDRLIEAHGDWLPEWLRAKPMAPSDARSIVA